MRFGRRWSLAARYLKHLPMLELENLLVLTTRAAAGCRVHRPVRSGVPSGTGVRPRAPRSAARGSCPRDWRRWRSPCTGNGRSTHAGTDSNRRRFAAGPRCPGRSRAFGRGERELLRRGTSPGGRGHVARAVPGGLPRLLQSSSPALVANPGVRVRAAPIGGHDGRVGEPAVAGAGKQPDTSCRPDQNQRGSNTAAGGEARQQARPSRIGPEESRDEAGHATIASGRPVAAWLASSTPTKSRPANLGGTNSQCFPPAGAETGAPVTTMPRLMVRFVSLALLAIRPVWRWPTMRGHRWHRRWSATPRRSSWHRACPWRRPSPRPGSLRPPRRQSPRRARRRNPPPAAPATTPPLQRRYKPGRPQERARRSRDRPRRGLPWNGPPGLVSTPAVPAPLRE